MASVYVEVWEGEHYLWSSEMQVLPRVGDVVRSSIPHGVKDIEFYRVVGVYLSVGQREPREKNKPPGIQDGRPRAYVEEILGGHSAVMAYFYPKG